ncbi:MULTISPECIES: TolC family protein [unclassified Aureispira]|uniref:TolC family protein n=1 Tax=unclassified Aureispira TaxID=2649989 RepID=UPI00069809D6|nr:MULTISPECIES: TolC family protein [unclassified Aureispira]WMX15769.1 TolC family protein [Aureispira sp. CCB-E]
MRRQILFLFFLLATVQVNAQDNDKWSLEKCINYAIQNSLQVQQATLNQSQAQLTKKQAVWAQAPNISAGYRNGVNIGNTVNPTNNELITIPNFNSGLSLNINGVIFQGLQIRNTIKQSKVDLEAAGKDVEQAKNDVALSVAQSYLAILLAEESKGVFEEQAKVTKAQYEQTIKLIEGGVLAENSKYDLEAQMARDEENIVIAQNNIDLAYVNLKVLMNVDVAKNIAIEIVGDLDVDETLEEATLEEVYEDAINSQPNILASKLREKSALLNVSIAKGALWPTVSYYAGFGSNYSTAYKNPVTKESIPYFVQLGITASANAGINISIPIFQGLRTRIGIQRAELGIKIAELATTQLEATLKSNIERALTDVRAAKKRLAVSRKSVTATRLSVENTRKRYELGVVNSFELTSVQNTLIASESSVLQAKYDYLFKLKILDYYRGRAITIKQ